MKRSLGTAACMVLATALFWGGEAEAQSRTGWVESMFPKTVVKIGKLRVKFDHPRGAMISAIHQRASEDEPFPAEAVVGGIDVKVRLRPEEGDDPVEAAQGLSAASPLWITEVGHQRVWVQSRHNIDGVLTDSRRQQFGKFNFKTYIYPCGEIFLNYIVNARSKGGIETAYVEIKLNDAFSKAVAGGDAESRATDLPAQGEAAIPLQEDDRYLSLNADGYVLGVYWRGEAAWGKKAKIVYASTDAGRFLRLYPQGAALGAPKSLKLDAIFVLYLAKTTEQVQQRAFAHNHPLATEAKTGFLMLDAAFFHRPSKANYETRSGAYQLVADERVGKGEFSFINDSDSPRHVHTVVYGLRRGGGVQCRQDGKALVPQLMSLDYYSLKYEGFATEAFLDLDIPASASSVLAVDEVEGVQLVWQKPGIFAWPREIRQFEVHNSKTPPKALAMRFAGAAGYCDLTKPGQRDFVCHFMPPWNSVTGDIELVVAKNGPDEVEFCFRGWTPAKLAEQWVTLPYRPEELRMKVRNVWTYLADTTAKKPIGVQFLDPWLFETTRSTDWYYDYLAFADKSEGVLLWQTNRALPQDWKEQSKGGWWSHLAKPRPGQKEKYYKIEGGQSTIYGFFPSDLGNLFFVPWVKKAKISMWICNAWSDTHTSAHWPQKEIKKGDQFEFGYTTSIAGDSTLTPELFIKLVEETEEYGEIEDFVGTDTAMCLIRTDAVIVLATKKGKQSIRIDEVKEKLAPVGRVRRYKEDAQPGGHHLIQMDLRVGKLAVLKRTR